MKWSPLPAASHTGWLVLEHGEVVGSPAHAGRKSPSALNRWWVTFGQVGEQLTAHCVLTSTLPSTQPELLRLSEG